MAGYAHAVEVMKDTDYESVMAEAVEYNSQLMTDINRLLSEEGSEERYYSLLDVAGSGVMGYVEIPKIQVKLPIYHGTYDAVLQVGAGHIYGTSLPVGGPGTHAAISGHRGLTSATLFTHLDELETGDMFYITTLGVKMAYEVDRIDVVLPDEVDLLRIEEGNDYVTLVTCTPYGVNSHRLLVRGTRVPYVEEEEAPEVTVVPHEEQQVDLAFIAGVAMLGLLIIACIIRLITRFQHKSKKKGRHLCE